MTILQALGHNHAAMPAGTAVAPTWGRFFTSIIIIAVLPGFCEEFATRGVLLNTMNRTFHKGAVILMLGIGFGLFHQNIRQFFYTAVMGVLLVYLTIELKSIWPAVIIHFVNNATSVYINFSNRGLNLPAGGAISSFNTTLFDTPALLVFFFLLMVGTVALLTAVIIKYNKGLGRGSIAPRAPVCDTVGQAGYFKPTLRDNAAFIGAIVTMGLSTLFSFMWGLFY